MTKLAWRVADGLLYQMRQRRDRARGTSACRRQWARRDVPGAHDPPWPLATALRGIKACIGTCDDATPRASAAGRRRLTNIRRGLTTSHAGANMVDDTQHAPGDVGKSEKQRLYTFEEL